MLLPHRDPHLTLGGLVQRLVRDGLDRYDPARPPRTRRTGGRDPVSSDGSAAKLAYGVASAQPAVVSAMEPDAEAVQRSVARAKRDGERRSHSERDDVSPASVREFVGQAGSAPKLLAKAERGNAKSSAQRAGVARASSPKRDAEHKHGGTESASVGDVVRGAAATANRLSEDRTAAPHPWRHQTAAGRPLRRRSRLRMPQGMVRRDRRSVCRPSTGTLPH